MRAQTRIIESSKVIAEKIRRSQRDGKLGSVIFFVGAGCSVSAGVPGATEIARRMVCEIARVFHVGPEFDDPTACYHALVTNGLLAKSDFFRAESGLDSLDIDWYRVYDQMFEKHYSTRDETRELFEKLLKDTAGAINWSHLCLGELLARNFVSTILTTNFDRLVLSGAVLAGVLPIVCDGVESLNRIVASPYHPQLIELHGSRHTYMLRNRPEDVKAFADNPIASGAILSLIQATTTFVVIGYAGRELGVMNLLIQAAKVFDDKNIFWIQHSNDPDNLSEQAAEFLATTRNGGLLLGQDSDEFFLELCKSLGVGAPSIISDPLRVVRRSIENVSACDHKHADIHGELEKSREKMAIADQAILRATFINNKADIMRSLRLSGKHAEAYAVSNEVIHAPE